MKRTISLILITCIMLSSIFALTSCFHECTFSEAWTADGENHWHACTHDGCKEVSDTAAHTWDEGAITTKATQEAEGIKTYTCTVCEHTKEEGVVFTGLDEDDWDAALTYSTFKNFTYVEDAVVKATGIEISTTASYKFTEGKAYAIVEAAGQTSTDTITGNDADETRDAMVRSIRSMLKHSEFTYDAENKVYNLTGNMYIESLGTIADTATVTFENGRLVEIKYTCSVISSGISMVCESTVTISDYGTTTIN